MTQSPPAPTSTSTPDRPDRYHHGDLRAALLAAAEVELAAHGIEGFSLRGVAKRAGVSHAAPAHHFRDANGLLTALAAEGFARLSAAMRARQQAAPQDALSRLVASGLGYIDFATAHPALFRLVFSSERPDHGATVLQSAATEAYQHLVDDVARLEGAVAGDVDEPMRLRVATAWAIVHGLADLMNAGRLKSILALCPAEREAALAQIIRGACRPPAP